jgi:hypothetical protein
VLFPEVRRLYPTLLVIDPVFIRDEALAKFFIPVVLKKGG